MLADIEDGENIRVIERGDGARFEFEAGEAIIFAREGFGENFEGDVAAKTRIAGARDFSHAAGAERGDDFVGAKFCAGSERHCERGL